MTEVSKGAVVRQMYEQVADSYGQMMDREIQLPIYEKTLSALAKHLRGLSGPLVDTSCGTGHLLQRYGRDFDPDRTLVGVDSSTAMVAASRARLGERARIREGDMSDLSAFTPGSLSGVVNFFSLHHLDARSVLGALQEWRRVLAPGGQLLLALWEGEGPIDYGEAADIVALRHPLERVMTWLIDARFEPELIEARWEEAMGMNSIYVRATAT